MELKKSNWQFVELEDRKSLSWEEVEYWKSILNKVLKFGIEIEANLPERRGACKGYRFNPDKDPPELKLNKCVCIHADRGCKGRCVNENSAACKEILSRERCPGVFCIQFLSSCSICKEFEINCDTCQLFIHPHNDPEWIREKIIEELSPSNDPTKSPGGIYRVTKDGSLLPVDFKGVEVITTGQRLVSFEALHSLLKQICSVMKDKGAYLNERCSVHIHCISGSYGEYNPNNGLFNVIANELEKSIPEIILANLFQLVKRYQPALVWLTSGLANWNRITRWEKFRINLFKFSPITSTMAKIKQDQWSYCLEYGNGKYGFLNLSSKDMNGGTQFDPDGNISLFHIEFRFPDGVFVPSAITAWVMLCRALIFRAIDLSARGTIEFANSKKEADHIAFLFSEICNTCPQKWEGPRTSNTKNVKAFRKDYVALTDEMLTFLKPELDKFKPSFEILEMLMDKPVSVRLIEGQTFDDIEKDFEVLFKRPKTKVIIKLEEIINMQTIFSSKSQKEWVKVVAKEIMEELQLNLSKAEAVRKEIENYINEKVKEEKIVWSKTIGTFIRKYS